MADWVPYGQRPAEAEAAAPAGDEGTEVCVVSGRSHPRREMIQYEKKWISAERREEFFQRQREGIAQPGQFIYGDFWPRFRAKFVDGFIHFVMGAIINVGLALALFDSANYFAAPARFVGTPQLLKFQVLSNLISVLLGVAYAWFFLSRYSATPGKMLLGLKVVRADGSALSTGRIIGRHFAEWLSSLTLVIGYVIAASDAERRTLHDRICDTRVIKAK